MHPFWYLVKQENKSNEQKVLVASVQMLSVLVFPYASMEQIYDHLLRNVEEGSIGLPTLTDETSVMKQLKKLEELIMGNTSSLGRLQTDQANLTALVTNIQSTLTNAVATQATVLARIESDIAALRNTSGSGDGPALDAIADSLESNMTALQAVNDQLAAASQVEAGADLAAVVTPSTASVAAGSTFPTIFGANQPVTWSATSGSIDINGNYLPPADTSITSDTVTATPASGGGLPGTALVTITGTTVSASGTVASPSANAVNAAARPTQGIKPGK